jgi:phage shock protein C
MNRYDEIPNRRFYRNRDRAFIAGVCAGLADYFGFNLKVTRVIAVISLLMAMPVTLLIYFATVVLIPSAPDPAMQPNVDADFRKALRSAPGQTLGDVKRRFQTLDSRLARLERYVTSPKYNLDREIRNL